MSVPGTSVREEAQGPGMGRQFTARDLAELLHADPTSPVLYPTADQAGIIEAPLEPLLVMAGAGSGKTKTMADRVVWLVANGHVRPEQILGVTFTRKAAGELATRIRQRLAALYRAQGSAAEPGADRLEPMVSTYHSFAHGIVQDYGLRLGVERDSTMLGAAQAWQLASSVVEAYRGEWEHVSAARSTLVKAVLDMAGECAEHLVTPAEVRRTLEHHVSAVEAQDYAAGTARGSTQAVAGLLDKLRTRITVTVLAEHYASAKASRRQLDFGDLVALAARVASDDPEAVQLERSKYRVVLLDEFQDTSFAQMVLFSKLFGDGRAVTAVGDPHQSIYGFRGASAGQLGTFRTAFPVLTSPGEGPAARSVSPVANLSVAWRNATSILAAANTVSAPLSIPPPWLRHSRSLQIPGLKPKPGAPTGEVYVGRFLSERTISSVHPGAERMVRGETAALAELVERHSARTFEHDAQGRRLRPTIAVLCRGRRQFEPIRKELALRGIPVQIVGLGGLLRTPEIVELLAVLRVLGDPGRSDSMLRLLSGARWRLGTADLMALSDWSRYLAAAREPGSRHPAPGLEPALRGGTEHPIRAESAETVSLVEAVDELPYAGWTSSSGRSLSESARTRLKMLCGELRELRGFVGDDLDALIHEVERRVLLDIEVAAKPGVGIHEARRNLDAFADAVAGYSSGAERVDLAAFLAWIEAADAEEDGLPITPLEASRDAVQLMTVHAAKGLEWDIVLVPGLSQGSFPSNRDSRWSSGDSAIPWSLRGDAPELPQWDWEQPDQSTWIASEKAFTDDARVHAEREERRLAYVAFTRAKHVLVCTSSVWGGGRSKPTEASPYLTALHELAQDGIPGFRMLQWIEESQEGDVNPSAAETERASWPADPLGRRRDAMEASAAAVLAAAAAQRHGCAASVNPGGTSGAGKWDEELRLVLARHARRRDRLAVELPEHISASLLVELTGDAEAVARQLRRPVPRKPGTAARTGTAFHAWVEEFYGTSGMLDLGEFRGAADSYVDDALQLETMISNFKGSEWARRVPSEIEVPVETRVGRIVVRGRIDAVFMDSDGTWDLIDWKTGKTPGAAELATRSVQLAVYRLAWSRLKDVPLGSVKAAFYYVGSNTLIRPHDLAGEDELADIIRRATAPDDSRTRDQLG